METKTEQTPTFTRVKDAIDAGKELMRNYPAWSHTLTLRDIPISDIHELAAAFEKKAELRPMGDGYNYSFCVPVEDNYDATIFVYSKKVNARMVVEEPVV